MPGSAAATLDRLVLLPSGEAFARFSDHSLLVLNAAAAAYALVEADGGKIHGMCACSRSALRPRLTAALHARNSLAPGAPRIVHDLLGAPFAERPDARASLRSDALHMMGIHHAEPCGSSRLTASKASRSAASSQPSRACVATLWSGSPKICQGSSTSSAGLWRSHHNVQRWFGT